METQTNRIDIPISTAPIFESQPQMERSTGDILVSEAELFASRAVMAFRNFETYQSSGRGLLGFQPQEGWSIEDERLGEFGQYVDVFKDAGFRSQEEFNANVRLTLDYQNRAETFARASSLSKFGSFVFDPINALPVFSFLKGATALARIGNLTATNLLLETGNQTLNYAADANFDIDMARDHVAYAGLSGIAFGGILEVGRGVLNDAFNNARRTYELGLADVLAIKDLQINNVEFPSVAQAQRQHGALSSEQLGAEIIAANRRLVGLENSTPPTQYAQQLVDQRIQQTTSQLNSLIAERRNRLIDQATVVDANGNKTLDPYRLVQNANPIPSPFSAILNEKIQPALSGSMNMLKRATLLLAGDMATITNATRMGLPQMPSVWISSLVERTRWKQVRDIASRAYTDLYGAKTGITNVGALTGQRETLNHFMDDALRVYALNETPRTPQQATAVRAISDFFENFADDLKRAGQLGDSTRISREIELHEITLRELKTSRSMAQRPDTIDYLDNRITEVEDTIKAYENAQLAYSSTAFKPRGENYIRRDYDIDYLQTPEGEAAFKQMLIDEFNNGGSFVEYNPQTKTYDRVTGQNKSQADIAAMADRVHAGMISDTRINLPTDSLLSSLQQPHRTLDISNSGAFPFIRREAMTMMQNYVERVAPKLHFSRLFDGKTPDQVWREIEDAMRVEGADTATINRMGLNFKTLESRVMQGGSLSDPMRWDNRAANYLKQFTTLNYLTSSGIPGAADFARIVQEHKLGDIVQGSVKMFTDPEFRRAMRDVQSEFGDGMELIMNNFHVAMSEGASRQVGAKTIWGRTMNANHILNLLGPVTTFLKQFDGALRQHTYINDMRAIVGGSATQFQIDYMNRFGLSISAMEDILKNAPIQQNGQFNLSNIDQWAINGVKPENIAAFRSAVNAGVSNSIIMATPADRPILSEGVLYIKSSTARMIPFLRNVAEDPKMTGYIKLESGLMTLPFQFQSYMMAAMNKVSGAYMTGVVRNRYAGIMASMGLGYLVAMAKTPQFVWDEMQMQDKLMRAFDYGGVAPLYTTMLYDGQAEALALGFNPPSSAIFAPKFPQEQNLADAIAGVGGPSISTLVDGGRIIGNLGEGNMNEAMGGFFDMLPLVSTVGVKTILNQFTGN